MSLGESKSLFCFVPCLPSDSPRVPLPLLRNGAASAALPRTAECIQGCEAVRCFARGTIRNIWGGGKRNDLPEVRSQVFNYVQALNLLPNPAGGLRSVNPFWQATATLENSPQPALFHPKPTHPKIQPWSSQRRMLPWCQRWEKDGRAELLYPVAIAK